MPVLRHILPTAYANENNVDDPGNLLIDGDLSYWYGTLTTQSAWIYFTVPLPLPNGAIVRKASIEVLITDAQTGTGEPIDVTSIIRYDPGISSFTYAAVFNGDMDPFIGSSLMQFNFPLETGYFARRHLLTQAPQTIGLYFELRVLDTTDTFDAFIDYIKLTELEYSVPDQASAPPFVNGL